LRYYQIEDKNNSFESLSKVSMNKLFSYKKKLKNGDDSKAFYMPSTEELHTNEEFQENWVKYSCLDAEST